MNSPADLRARARELMGAGRWREARPLLEALASRPEHDAGVVLQLAELDILDGAPARALERIAAVDAAHHPDAEYLTARAEEALGRRESARDRLLALRARLPAPSANLELQLALVRQRLGDPEGAIASAQAALAIQPALTAAHKMLASLFASSARLPQARAILEQGLAAAPRDPGLWLRLAHVQTQMGDAAGAIASLAHAAEAEPTDAHTWSQIGHLFGEHWKFAEADRALARAAALDPGAPGIESLRALVKQELGDTPGAMQALAAAAARDPNDLRVVVAERLFLPQVYSDAEDVARWRQRYATGLDALARDAGGWLERAGDIFSLERNNFFLAYQGEDDRELQRRYSAFLARLAGAAAPQLRAPLARTFDGGRRLRVGFLGNIFRESTAGRYFERWVTGLDPARFERFVYHTAPVVDHFTHRIATATENFHHERLGTRETAELVRSHGLDVLVYPEVGMSSMTYLLAALRLAPVQCAGWGHPVTTGSDAIDYYFTCGPMEPPDGAEHYTERLVALPGIGVDYAMPEEIAAVGRAQLGLPTDRRIYLCAQSLFKVHPEMDALFAEILERDPGGVLVLFQATARAVTEQVAARIQRALEARGLAPRGQVKFLPRMSGPFFRAALAVSDVVLDTVRWSGGNTSMDAFAAGTPVVTVPGRFMRGRQTSAMLDMLGLPELAAATGQDYVGIATGLARDADRNAHVRRAIAERREVLFNRREAAQAFQDALLRLAAGLP